MCDKCVEAGRSKAPRWKGKYDRAALRRACEELGVRRPVRVLCTESAGVRPDEPLPEEGIDFGYHLMRDDGQHEVSVTRWLPIDVANHTFLHELAHCRQAEQHGLAGNRRAKMDELVYGYSNSPHEVEAEEVADRMETRFTIPREG